MKGFIKVKVSCSRFARINVSHIIYYEPYMKSGNDQSFTRIYIPNDCIETETHITEIDEMIVEAGESA